LELTRAVAQTVPDFFLKIHFAGGLHQCRGWVCQPETAVCVIPTLLEGSQKNAFFQSPSASFVTFEQEGEFFLFYLFKHYLLSAVFHKQR
jgi:hypothetical protein